MKNRRKWMKTTEKDGFREFIRKHNRMRWKHRKWSRNTQKLNKRKKMMDMMKNRRKTKNDEIQKGEWVELVVKRMKTQNEERINQVTMIKKWTHSKQKKPRKLMETNEKQKKINRKEWNRWGLRIYMKTE